jgi:hypothetical protein
MSQGFYRVEVTAEDGSRLELRDCGNLEGARRAVAEFRGTFPDARWITTNRHNKQRVTAMISMSVFRGSTAQERRATATETETKGDVAK